MNLQELRVLLVAATALAALVVASPAIQKVFVYPQSEPYTELWLLGPGHVAGGVPYNITSGASYNFYLDISNHLGEAAYYSVQVKFRNESQSAPDGLNGTASNLDSLYSLNVFVADKENWELPVIFSFDYSYDASHSLVRFNKLMFNSASLDLEGLDSSWDSGRGVFYGNLFFELWIYNGTTGSFQYHQRYVDFKFNMTV